MATLKTRLAEGLARLPGRRAPVKGWSLVTEWLHRHAHRQSVDVVHQSAYRVKLRLDLRDYTQRGMFYDAYETQELNFMEEVLRPGDVVIDVGANIGLFTLVAARAVGPSGSVHAFEPVPGNCERLEENVQLNGFTNVRLNKSAVRDRAGTVALAIDAEMARTSGASTSSFFTVTQLADPVREVTAQAETIDDYSTREVANRSIRLVKIDVEGSEPAVLAGMSDVLKSHRVDVLMLEVSLYGLARSGSRILDVVEPLRTAGYDLYRLGVGGLLTRWSYLGEPSIPERGGGEAGMIRGLYKGLQDLSRLFNLVAIRSDHPAMTGRPRFMSAGKLRRSA
ncbi:FkbM family methyltransferase [bacterium]|nr:MAG: FkbM family methyltransferase [bacterium]